MDLVAKFATISGYFGWFRIKDYVINIMNYGIKRKKIKGHILSTAQKYRETPG